MKRYLRNLRINMELSIILVSYNTSKITLNCIKSIINSNLGNKYEIIVVDNKSTDNTAHIAKSFGVRVVFEEKLVRAHDFARTNTRFSP